MKNILSWFKSIKGKLLVSAMVPFVGFIFSGYISFSGTSQLTGFLDSVHTDVIPNIKTLYQMREARNKFSFQALAALGGMKLGIDPTEHINLSRSAIEEYKTALDHYSKAKFTPEETKQFAEVKEVFPQFIAMMEKIQRLIESKDATQMPEAEGLLYFELDKHGKVVGSFTEATLQMYTQRADVEGQQAQSTSASVNFWMSVVIASSTLIALILSAWNAINITNILSSITSRLSVSSSSVTSSVEQLTQSGNSLSQSSTESAASLEETVASLEEMTSMVQLNSDNAKQAATLSASSREAAEKGEQEIESLIHAMTEISKSSKKIEEIISVIDDIAFQTNLLALNASVEAARAGEQGKGFAVVAEAVRALAQRSADAAKDINGLIKDSVSQVEQGGQIAGQSSTVLHNIVTSVKKVADLNNEIASASAEQTAGIQQISKAMNQLDQSAQSNAASAEEIAATSSEINNLAVTTQKLTEELSSVIDGKMSVTSPSSSAKPQKASSPKTDEKVAKVLQFPKKNMHKSESGLKKAAPAKSEAQATIPFDDETDHQLSKVGTTDGF